MRGIDPNYSLYSEPECKNWGLHEPHTVRLDFTYICTNHKACGRSPKTHEKHAVTYNVPMSCTGDPKQELML